MLSGDDALTLPLMAIGGRGIISVASNEAPAEMVQMVEAAERGDFATARHWHDKLLPLMQINFVESSPGPVKFAMAAMGLCEHVFRLPMVPPRPAAQEKSPRRAARLRPADRRRSARLVSLSDTISGAVRRGHRPLTKRPRARHSSSCSGTRASGDVRAAEPDPSAPPAGASTPG